MTDVTISTQKVDAQIVAAGINANLVTSPVVSVIIGIPGPKGAPGSGGGGDSLTFVAGQSLSALRVVYGDENNEALYADKDDIDTIKNILGVTTNAAISGDDVTVETLGVIADASFAWNMSADKSLFLGDNGAIVQGPPSGVNLVRIGFAITTTSMFVRLGEYVALS